MSEMPDLPVVAGCPCYSDGRMPCACGVTERVLRTWSARTQPLMMTTEQREWCLREIDSIEGYRRADYERAHDADLARGVLNAWTDYARDKGIL